jgi:phosphate transport system protein
MSRMAQQMVKEVLDAYIARDVDKAVAVWHSDETLDNMYTSLFREALTYMIEDPRSISMCTHLLFIAKNIERIGDHVTNIRETRPKGSGDVDTMNMTFSRSEQEDAKE